MGNRATEGVHDALCKLGELRQVAAAAAENDEFIATDAGDEIVMARVRAQNGSGMGQHGIAGLVPERVVDLFETIEVDMQDGIDRDVLRQHLIKVAPVWQIRQVVVQGVVFDPDVRLLEPRLRASAEAWAWRRSSCKAMSSVTSQFAPMSFRVPR